MNFLLTNVEVNDTFEKAKQIINFISSSVIFRNLFELNALVFNNFIDYMHPENCTMNMMDSMRWQYVTNGLQCILNSKIIIVCLSLCSKFLIN